MPTSRAAPFCRPLLATRHSNQDDRPCPLAFYPRGPGLAAFAQAEEIASLHCDKKGSPTELTVPRKPSKLSSSAQRVSARHANVLESSSAYAPATPLRTVHELLHRGTGHHRLRDRFAARVVPPVRLGPGCSAVLAPLLVKSSLTILHARVGHYNPAAGPSTSHVRIYHHRVYRNEACCSSRCRRVARQLRAGTWSLLARSHGLLDARTIEVCAADRRLAEQLRC